MASGAPPVHGQGKYVNSMWDLILQSEVESMKLYVKVIPNSKQEKLDWISENTLKIHLKEPAEKGKANQKILKILSKQYEHVQIISGFKKHRKIIEVKEAI